jgi:hypothetical protein
MITAEVFMNISLIMVSTYCIKRKALHARGFVTRYDTIIPDRREEILLIYLIKYLKLPMNSFENKLFEIGNIHNENELPED